MVGNAREDGEYSGYFWKLINISQQFPLTPFPSPLSTHTKLEKGVGI